MATTLNDRLRDSAIARQVSAIRVSKAIARRVRALIEESEVDTSARLAARLALISERGFDTGAVTTARLEALFKVLAEQNRELVKEIRGAVRGDLIDLAKLEATALADELSSALPPSINIVRPAVSLLRSAAVSDPIVGRPLNSWFDGLEATRRAYLEQAVRLGLTTGETVPQITARVIGTKSLGYADGALETSRRFAEAIVRTAVTHTSARARELVAQSSGERVVRGLVWYATLDHTRTCITCAGLDGKVFPIGKGPRPPAHVACRCSLSIATRSWREMGLDVDELDPPQRASIDGVVSGAPTFDEWLRRQSAAVQDEALGPTRGELFRAGTAIDRFSDRRLRPLPLPELYRKLGIRQPEKVAS